MSIRCFPYGCRNFTIGFTSVATLGNGVAVPSRGHKIPYQLKSKGMAAPLPYGFRHRTDRLEIQPDDIHTRVEKLWFATPLGHSSLGSGLVIRRVANRLRRYFLDDDSNHKSHHRIYISRRKAAYRRIVNENEISPSLRTRL